MFRENLKYANVEFVNILTVLQKPGTHISLGNLPTLFQNKGEMGNKTIFDLGLRQGRMVFLGITLLKCSLCHHNCRAMPLSSGQ